MNRVALYLLPGVNTFGLVYLSPFLILVQKFYVFIKFQVSEMAYCSHQGEDGEAKIDVGLPEVLEFTQGRVVNVELVFVVVLVAHREANDLVRSDCWVEGDGGE